MKVLFESKYLYGQRTGLGEYTINMLKAMLATRPHDQSMIVTTDRSVPREVAGPGLEYRVIPGRYKTQVLREQLQIPICSALWRIDLIYSFAAPLPRYRTARGIFTLHDVWRLKVRENRDDNYLMRYHPQSALSADRVVTVSEFSKQEICKLLPISPKRVKVIYPGPSEGIVPQRRELAQRIVKSYGFDRPYLFTLSDLSPRKKLDLLLRAMPLVEAGYDLVVARQPREQKELWELIQKLGLKGRVHIMGFVDSKMLNALYSAADIFVLPSIYEGFGMPIVEAFKAGIPVVAFNVASIPEVAGGAALLAEVSEEALAWAINKLIGDTALQQELREKGYRRQEDFSWSRAASRAWELISDLN